MEQQVSRPSGLEALRMGSRPLQQSTAGGGQGGQQRQSFFSNLMQDSEQQQDVPSQAMQQPGADQQDGNFKQFDFQWKQLKPYNAGGLASRLQLSNADASGPQEGQRQKDEVDTPVFQGHHQQQTLRQQRQHRQPDPDLDLD